MLNIEIEPYVLEPGEKQYYYIVVNDIVDDESFCYQDSESKLWSVSLYSQHIYEELLRYSFQELRIQVEHFTFSHLVEGYNLSFRYIADSNVFIRRGLPYSALGKVRAEFRIESEDWKKPFTVKEFALAVEESVKSLGLVGIESYRDSDDFVTNGFGLIWDFSPEDNMGECELSVLAELRRILGRAQEILMQNIDPHALLSYFRFPDEIKTPCTQYLVYFAQFLADLGIDAEVELSTQDSGATLFKVVPQDKDSSLKSIRDALDVYLAASATQFTYAAADGTTDVALMQLQANVMHLQSQLMLARSSVQMKDATIGMLELTNFQLKQQLSTADDKDQTEDILPGVLSVSKLESNGVSLNLAEILKRLKRKLRF